MKGSLPNAGFSVGLKSEVLFHGKLAMQDVVLRMRARNILNPNLQSGGANAQRAFAKGIRRVCKAYTRGTRGYTRGLDGDAGGYSKSFPRRFDINSTAAFSLQRCYTDLITHLCLWDLRWYPQHEFPHAVAQSIRRFPRHIGFTPDKLWMPCIKQDTSPTSELTD